MSPVTWGVLLALAWLALAAVLALVIGRVVANAETRRGTPPHHEPARGGLHR